MFNAAQCKNNDRYWAICKGQVIQGLISTTHTLTVKVQRDEEERREGGIVVDYQPWSSDPAPLLLPSFHPPLLPLSSITELISPAN